MATRTQNDLARDVLRDLGIIDALHDPSAEDNAHIKRRYTEALEELRDDGLVFWDANAIPLEVYPAVLFYMNVLISGTGTFGGLLQGNLDDVLESAKRRLRRRLAKRSSGEQTQFSSF